MYYASIENGRIQGYSTNPTYAADSETAKVVQVTQDIIDEHNAGMDIKVVKWKPVLYKGTIYAAKQIQLLKDQYIDVTNKRSEVETKIEQLKAIGYESKTVELEKQVLELTTELKDMYENAVSEYWEEKVLELLI